MSEGGQSHFRLYLLILLMVVLWSANFIFGKFAVRELPALMVVGLRMLLAGLMMLPVYFIEQRRAGERGWTRDDVPLLLGLGVLGIGLNQLLFVCGLARTSVGHAAVMIALTPVLVLILAALIGLEKLSVPRLAGMVLAVAGVSILQISASGRRGSSITGDCLVLLGAITFALFTVAGKATMGRTGGIVVNTFAYVGSAIALLPATIYLSGAVPVSSISLNAWGSVFYMALCPSVIAYLIYYYALERIPASRLSAFVYLQPLFATAMAIPALGEYPTRALLLGGAFVLAGVVVAERL